MKKKKAKKSKWAKEAEYRITNRKWLRYSSNIARRVLSAIEDHKEKKGEFNQAILAGIIGVSAQYISKVVKGKENLSLETIAKLSEALEVELITFPSYKYSSMHVMPTMFACDVKIFMLSDDFTNQHIRPLEINSISIDSKYSNVIINELWTLFDLFKAVKIAPENVSLINHTSKWHSLTSR